MLLVFLVGCVSMQWEESRPVPPDISATVAAAVSATLAAQPTPTLVPTCKPTPANTATPVPSPTLSIALITFHGRYVVATDGSQDWLLKQETSPGDCGRFTLHDLNGKVALETCHHKYVTAAMTGTTSLDWALGQEPKLDDCGWFIRHSLGQNKVAFETCAGRYWTAAGDSWEPELHWVLIAQTYKQNDWETFTVQILK